jgi:hypothetical protein
LAEFSVAAFAGSNPCEARHTTLKAYSYIVDGVLHVGAEQVSSEFYEICPAYVSPVFKTLKVVAPFPVGEVSGIVLENVGEMGRVQKYSVPQHMK